jgi:hypothetical protein
VRSLELGGPAPEHGKIVGVVQATNLFAAVSLTLDFKNGAEEQFGRKLLDCEPNGGRRSREAFVPNRRCGDLRSRGGNSSASAL